jgi:hypothetical protein
MLSFGPLGTILVGLIFKMDGVTYEPLSSCTGNPTKRAYLRMTPIIMSLDMLKVGRNFERGIVPV